MAETRQIILLHGALGTADTVTPVAGLLRDAFDAYCPDLPGHGNGKMSPEALSLADFVEFLDRYIKTENLQQPCIFGFSMGGYIALAHAVKYPGVISRIVTLGTKYNWSPEIAEQEARMLDPDLIEQKVPAFATVLRERHGDHHWKSLMHKTVEMMHDLGRFPLLTPDTVRDVTLPVAILRGRDDRMVTAAESQAMAEVLPNGRYRDIPGIPHPIEKIPADTIADLIRSAFG